MGEMQVDGKPGTLAVPGHLDGVYAAGNGRRAMAYLIEVGIGLVLGVVSTMIFAGAFLGAMGSMMGGSGAGIEGFIVAMFLPIILEGIFGIVNFVLMVTRGQSVGRYFAKTRMIRFDTGKQAGIRGYGKILLGNLVVAVPIFIGAMIDGSRSVDYYYYTEPATPIFIFLFGIAGVAGFLWIVFKTQDEANRHWIDRTCGVLTIDLRQGRDSNDQDSYTGFVPTSQPGLEAPSLGGADLRNKEVFPPLPPEYKASTLVPPLPPLSTSNGSVPPLPPKPAPSLPSTPPLPPSPSSTPPFSSAAVPTPPVPTLASEHVPPLPSTPPPPSDPIAAGTLPPTDGFIDEVPWRKPEFASPAPTPEPSIVPPPLDLHEESHLDQTVVSPRNTPVTLVFDDGTSYVLEQGVVVGRDPQCDSSHQGAIRLQVDDPSLSVSKTHMALALKAGALLVEDLHSTNGTQVTTPEGQTSDVLPGSPIIVARGALIHFGDRSVRVSE